MPRECRPPWKGRGESVLTFQLGKENDVPNCRGPREKHDQSIYTDTDSSCRGHPMLQCFDKILVDFLCLTTTLLLETGALRVGVIKFRVSRRNLLPVNNELVNCLLYTSPSPRD